MQVEAEPHIIVLNNCSHLTLEVYTGESLYCDVEEFFGRFRQWTHLHRQRFDNDGDRSSRMYVLWFTALQWFNDIPAAAAPCNWNDLGDAFYENIRIRKKRFE